jgi:hypothetical protein
MTDTCAWTHLGRVTQDAVTEDDYMCNDDLHFILEYMKTKIGPGSCMEFASNGWAGSVRWPPM